MARYYPSYTSPLISPTCCPQPSPYYNDRERERTREKKYNSSGGYDRQLQRYSPDDNNSLTSIAPGYGFTAPHETSRVMIRGGASVVEEPVVEHEHHHVHHHIDHGNVDVSAQVAVRPRAVHREYSYDDLYEHDRRHSSLHRHGHHYHGHRPRNTGSRYARSDIDLNLESSLRSRRGSVYDDRESEYAIIDVPAGTRRVTVDMAREQDSSINWRRDNGVRRSRGLGNELWTEITKDLVTREAIEDCGYQYEETEFFYYIFEYLHRDQISELIDLTADIRRYRVRDIEYESIASAGRESRRALEYDQNSHNHTEIIIENSKSNAGGRRRRYYY